MRFRSHLSIKKIKQNFDVNEKITFQVATVNEVEQSNKRLLKNKAAGGDIPLKVLKQSSKFCFEELRYCINYAFSHGKFLDSLKIANGTHVHKKDDPTDKTNLHLSTKKICPTDKTNLHLSIKKTTQLTKQTLEQYACCPFLPSYLKN